MKKLSQKKPSESIEVCVRMRPLLSNIEDEEVWAVSELSSSIYCMKSGKLAGDIAARKKNTDSQEFFFDIVEGTASRTQNIYNKAARKIVLSVLEGYNGTIFMYGQTTSGKTFTNLGTKSTPGFLICALLDIFNEIQKNEEDSYSVWVSYLELYNESINDLLNPGSSNLKLQDDPEEGVKVVGLKKQQIWSFDQALILLEFGEEHRIYRETSVHEHSSRSHTIFKIYIESSKKNDRIFNKKIRKSHLNMVDLAGSERLIEYDPKSEQVGETGYINKSLFVLANVINKLADDKKSHIPYRDSKLTRLLAQALGGNSLTLIVCCVSPAAVNFHQTLSTLRFASRAKSIMNRPEINETDEEAISELAEREKKIEELQGIVTKLTEKHNSVEKENIALSQNSLQLNQKVTFMNAEISELREALMEARKQLNFYEKELKKAAAGSEQNKNNSHLVEKLHTLNERYNQERLLRLDVEKKLLNHNDSAKRGLLESNFIDGLTIQTDHQINTHFSKVEDSNENRNKYRLYVEEKEDLDKQYNVELLHLQNKYRGLLKILVTEVCPEVLETIIDTLSHKYSLEKPDHLFSLDILKKIQNRSVFSHIPHGFKKSILESPASEFNISLEQGGVLKKSKNKTFLVRRQYEEIKKELEESYSEAKAVLDYVFRQKIKLHKIAAETRRGNKSIYDSPYVNRIESIEAEHKGQSEVLQKLYEIEIKQLENEYVESLQTLEEQSQLYGSVEDKGGLRYSDIASFSSPKVIEEIPAEDIHRTITEDERNYEQPLKKTPKFKGKTNRDPSQTVGAVRIEDPDIRSLDFTSDSYTKQRLIQSENLTKLKIEKKSGKTFGMPGRVYLWGSGKDGRLGNNCERSERKPMRLPNMDFTSIVCGFHHSAATSTDGRLYTWGKNKNGQLGHNDYESVGCPKWVKMLKNYVITQVSCGWQHTMALTEVGAIFSWGYGEDGQLGHGSRESYKYPRRIESLDNIYVTKIATGHSHSGAITESGELYLWGCNSDFRLMINNNTNQQLPVLCTLSSLKVDKGISSLAVEEVSLGLRHTLALTSTGEVYSAGYGNDGQLGFEITNDIPNVIFAKRIEDFGEENSLFEDDSDAEIEKYCFFNKIPSFGLGQPKAIKVSAGENFSLILDEKNRVFSCGKSSFCRLGQPNAGKNRSFQTPLQLKSFQNVRIANISAGTRHGAALSEDGKVFVWGFNFYDQLGLGFSDRDVESPILNPFLENVRLISCGFFHTGVLVDPTPEESQEIY